MQRDESMPTISERHLLLWLQKQLRRYKTVEVEVIDRIIPIKEIQIKNTDLSVYATASLQLETSYLPLEATYSSLSWTSLTPEIASVTDEGLVKGWYREMQSSGLRPEMEVAVSRM